MNADPSKNTLKNFDIHNIDKNETKFFDLYFNFISKPSSESQPARTCSIYCLLLCEVLLLNWLDVVFCLPFFIAFYQTVLPLDLQYLRSPMISRTSNIQTLA